MGQIKNIKLHIVTDIKVVLKILQHVTGVCHGSGLVVTI